MNKLANSKDSEAFKCSYYGIVDLDYWDDNVWIIKDYVHIVHNADSGRCQTAQDRRLGRKEY